MSDLKIRAFDDSDWDAVWKILKPVFRAGETYAVPPGIGIDEAHELWVEKPLATFVAEDESGNIHGTYFIKPNQSGPGSHVSNCGYIVGEEARGMGIASKMCVHSQQTAIDLGFTAMQYNLVVSTNQGAVRLWQKHGFEIVGTIPRAFRHPGAGLVDAFVMYKELVK